MAARLRGGPTTRSHTLHLPGRLPPERRYELTAALDRILGAGGTPPETPRIGEPGAGGTPAEAPGTGGAGAAPGRTEAPGAGGGAFEWAEEHTQGRTAVRVDPGPAGGSAVTVRADRRGWAAALNLAALGAGIGAGALAGPATGSAAVGVALGLVVWGGLVRLVWRPYSRRLCRRLEASVMEVAARLDDGEEA